MQVIRLSEASENFCQIVYHACRRKDIFVDHKTFINRSPADRLSCSEKDFYFIKSVT